MKTSVILCTYNRAAQLKEALESVVVSMRKQSVDCEVVVVDNNSRDGTKDVVAEFNSHYPGTFRYIFEAQQGKSFALNRGIRESKGDLLAFVDDDVTVEPDWLGELTGPFCNEQWVGAAGRVYLPKDFLPPSWMKLDGPYGLGPVLALFDLGGKAEPLSVPPIGANMAFRKEVFEKYGGFRSDLGPRPGSEIRFEDTEFGGRLLKRGEKLLYVPTAIVYHAIPERRLKKQYYLRYFFDYGRGLIRERGERPGIGFIPRPVIGLGNRLLNKLPRKIWNWLKEDDPQKRFFEKCLVWSMVGEIAELVQCLFSLHSPETNVHARSTKP
jgi:glucosyl-dolichyl phosphate glucuronosyltransferase